MPTPVSHARLLEGDVAGFDVVEGSAESFSTDEGTVGGDEMVGYPDSPVSAGLSLGGGWTVVDSDRPGLLTLRLFAETDGTDNGTIRVEVDYSGGTSSDDVFRCYVNDAAGAGVQVDETMTISLPAGASVNIVNSSDPNNSNALLVDSFTQL